MRKSVLLALVVLLAAVWVVAQTSTGQTGATSGTQTSTPGTQASTSTQGSTSGQNTIEGCLSGSEHNYTLADRSGNTYQLTGETTQLSKHVGEEVELTGQMASSGMGTSGTATAGTTGAATAGAGAAVGTPPSGQSNIGATTGTSQQTPGTATSTNTFNVSKVKKISGTCSKQ